jgi:hypothetical protein
MSQSTVNHAAARFELRFRPLHEGRALAFPCDRDGQVDLDSLSDRARNNYLFARAMVGREYAVPFIDEQFPDGSAPIVQLP